MRHGTRSLLGISVGKVEVDFPRDHVCRKISGRSFANLAAREILSIMDFDHRTFPEQWERNESLSRRNT
jgi:hypothetical protein